MKIINFQGKSVAVLQGSAPQEFGFLVAVVWPNLVLVGLDGSPGTEVTYFGGTKAQDPADNGLTASGARTRNPDGTENQIYGCALPVLPSANSGTPGSPLPQLTWRTPVRFTHPTNGRSLVVPLIDNGPARGTKHGADLTRLSSKTLNNSNEPDSIPHCEVQILRGAYQLPAAALAQLRSLGLIPKA